MLADFSGIMAEKEKGFKTSSLEQEVKKLVSALETFAS